jgi:hypothetical protein
MAPKTCRLPNTTPKLMNRSAGCLGHKDGGVLAARAYGHLRNEHSAAMAKRMNWGASTAESVNAVAKGFCESRPPKIGLDKTHAIATSQ